MEAVLQGICCVPLLLYLHGFASGCDQSASLENPCNNTDISNTCAAYKIVNASHTMQYLTSPNYPKQYPHNIICRWLITNPAKEGSEGADDNVKLFLEVMDMESSGSCTKDFVELRDGSRIWNLVLGRHCGKKCPNDNKTDPNVSSTAKRVLVTFQTDTPQPDPINYTGFKIGYKLERAQKKTYKDLKLTAANFILIGLFGAIVVPFATAFVVLVYLDFKRSQRLRILQER